MNYFMEYFDINEKKPDNGALCMVQHINGTEKLLRWIMNRWWEYHYDETTNTNMLIMLKNSSEYNKWCKA